MADDWQRTILQQLAQNLGERVDEDLLPSLYARVQLQTDTIHKQFRKANIAWVDPQSDHIPSKEELLQASSIIIRQSTRKAGLRGAISGLGGIATIPPETVVALVQTLHLAQRLTALFGHDPQTERGHLMLAKVLAAAFHITLPKQQSRDIRLTQLPQVLRQNSPDSQKTTAWLTRTVALRSFRRLSILGRLMPGVSAGFASWEARKTIRAQGERMVALLQKGWVGRQPTDAEIIEAVEVS